MNKITTFVSRNFAALAAFAGLLAVSGTASAQEEAGSYTYIDPGVDMQAAITSGAEQLGLVLGVAVGAYVGFLVVKKALSWLRLALGA